MQTLEKNETIADSQAAATFLRDLHVFRRGDQSLSDLLGDIDRILSRKQFVGSDLLIALSQENAEDPLPADDLERIVQRLEHHKRNEPARSQPEAVSAPPVETSSELIEDADPAPADNTEANIVDEPSKDATVAQLKEVATRATSPVVSVVKAAQTFEDDASLQNNADAPIESISAADSDQPEVHEADSGEPETEHQQEALERVTSEEPVVAAIGDIRSDPTPVAPQQQPLQDSPAATSTHTAVPDIASRQPWFASNGYRALAIALGLVLLIGVYQSLAGRGDLESRLIQLEEQNTVLAAGNAEFETVRQQLDEARRELAGTQVVDAEVTRLEGELKLVQQELKQAQEAGAEAAQLASELEGARQDVRDAQSNSQSLGTEIGQLKQQVQRQQEQLESTQQQFAQTRSELTDTRTAFAELQTARSSELSQMGEELQSRDTALQAIRSELTSAEAQIAELRKTASSGADSAANLQVLADKLRGELDRQRQAATRSEQEYLAVRSELTASLEKTQGDAQALRSTLNKRDAELETASDELNATRDKLKVALTQGELYAGEIDTLKQKSAELELRLATQASASSESATALLGERDALLTNLEAANSELKKLQQSLGKRDARIASLRSQVATMARQAAAQVESVETAAQQTAVQVEPTAAVNSVTNSANIVVVEPPEPEISVSANSPAVDELLRRGRELMGLGDLASARLVFEMAAEQGSAEAATAAGNTYDPLYISEAGIQGAFADPTRATRWYQRAIKRGDQSATRHLEALGQWGGN